MITKKRVILIANPELGVETAQEEFRYEAIVVTNNIDEIETIWSHNKIPLIVGDAARKKRLSTLPEHEEIDLPEYTFGKEHFISFCHNNGFECGERIKEKKFDTKKDKCFLCDIANHGGMKGPTYRYNERTARDDDLIIYESENFFIKVELGCLSPGMVMINPKAHVLSIAQLEDKLFSEYFQVMRDVEFILKAVYGEEKEVIFFEHGSAPDGISSHERSIVHAHTHVAVGVKFPQMYIDMVSLKPAEDISSFKMVKYLSYQEGTQGKLYVVSDPEVYVQRQFPRQVIGELLGIENYRTNWRVESFMENVVKTYEDIWEFLSKKIEFLHPRIRKATEGFVKGYPLRNKKVDK